MPKRKVLDEDHTPLPDDPHTGLPAHPGNLLEITDGWVQYCWPWPFKDKHDLEAAAKVACVPADHPLMHETVHLLRRHVYKRHLVKGQDLPAKARPKKGVADILEAVTALIDAHGRLSTEEYAIIMDGVTDSTLANAVMAAAAVQQQLLQLDVAQTLPQAQGGAPRKPRNILIGQLDRAYSRHRGEGAKRRNPFIECCLAAIGEPGEPSTIKEAIRSERKTMQTERQRMEGQITPPFST